VLKFHSAQRANRICLVIISLAAAGKTSAQAVLDETEVKAVFLINFAKFVEWPANNSGPLAFCVIGDDSMATSLGADVVNKSIGSRPLTVRNQPDMSELGSCSVIYIGRNKKSVAAQVAQTVAGKQVLTVSEFAELGAQGVVINFYLNDQRVRFEIHRRALNRSGLKISSKLLSLARVVGE
jgi:hypothetical protein